MRTLNDLNESIDRSHQARGFVEWIRAKATAPFGVSSMAVLEERLGSRAPFVERLKAVVGPVSIGSGTASDLTIARLGNAFLELVRRRSVLGQLATLPAPPNTAIPIATTAPEAAWVREFSPIPATSVALDTATLDITKIAAILAFALEFLRVTDDRATSLFERLLVRAVRDIEDATLLDDQDAVPLERPRGLLYGLSALGAGSPANIALDLQELWRAVRDGEPEAPAFICSPRGAVYLATLTDGTGGPLFPNVSPMGGDIWGVPQLASKAAADRLILVDAGALAVSDLGITFDTSDASAIQMSTTPSAGAAAAVSAWQSDLRLLKMQRYLNWVLGYEDGVAFLTLPLGSPA